MKLPYVFRNKLIQKHLLFSVLFITIIGCQFSFAQTQNNSTVENTVSSSCEMNTVRLTDLMQNAARNEFIIVISHLENKEKKSFGQRRLNNVEILFTKGSTDNTNNRSLGSFLIAEGKRVNGEGFLDFYVKGNLYLRIKFDKNRDFPVSPCVFTPEEKPCSTTYEKLLYPCKK